MSLSNGHPHHPTAEEVVSIIKAMTPAERKRLFRHMDTCHDWQLSFVMLPFAALEALTNSLGDQCAAVKAYADKATEEARKRKQRDRKPTERAKHRRWRIMNDQGKSYQIIADEEGETPSAVSKAVQRDRRRTPTLPMDN